MTYNIMKALRRAEDRLEQELGERYADYMSECAQEREQELRYDGADFGTIESEVIEHLENQVDILVEFIKAQGRRRLA